MLALLLACEPAPDSGSEAVELELSQASNWALSGALELPTLEVDPDVRFQPAPVTDLLGLENQLLPSVGLYWFSGLSLEELEYELLRGTVTQSNVTAVASGPVSGIEFGFDEFMTTGMPPPVSDWLREASGSYVLAARDTNWALALLPLAGAEQRARLVGGGSLTLAGTANAELPVPAGTEQLSWAGLTSNAWGQPWGSQPVDTVSLYAFGSEAELAEAAAYPLGAAPSAAFSATVVGSSVRLDDLESEADGAFQGFDDRVWVVALSCGACAVHAPVYAAQLAPE